MQHGSRSAPPSANPAPSPLPAGADPRPLAVFLNHRAGRGATSAGLALEVRDAFARASVPVEVHLPELLDLVDAVRAEAARRPRAIVVGGGDGTLSIAAGVLAGTGIAFGILPLGTFNHFAKDAGVPTDWRAAVEMIAGFSTREVDVAEVNGRVFLNTCSIGGYTEALRRREVLRRRAGHGKAWAMLLGVMGALRRVPQLHVEMEAADWSARLRASFILIVNNRYQDDALLSGRRTRLDEGCLGVYASRVYRWRDIGRAALDAWRLGLHGATELKCWESARLTLHYRESPLTVAIDGEMAKLELPLHFHSRPRALRIIAPPPAAAPPA